MSKLTETGALCYLKIIKKWCESQKTCNNCPFTEKDSHNGCSFPRVPFTWELSSILIAPPYEWEVGDDTEEEKDEEGETFEDEDTSLIEDILSEDDDIEKSQENIL